MSGRAVQAGESFCHHWFTPPDLICPCEAKVGAVVICGDFTPATWDHLSPEWRRHCANCEHARWKHDAAALALAAKAEA